MIGLDTDVVLRHFVQGDIDRAAVAPVLVESPTETRPGLPSLITVVEVHRVLRRAHRVDADRCAELLQALLEALLDSREPRVDRDGVVRAALAAARGGPDFADAVTAELGRVAGCDRTVTVDGRASHGGATELLPTRSSPS